MYKLNLPYKFKSHWQGYWGSQTLKENLDDCKTDGLNPIFKKYLPKSGEILEAGCGFGKWVMTLKGRGYNIIGVDDYKPAIEAAKKFKPDVPLFVADVTKFPFSNNKFSAYISLGVIEHFENGPKDVLKEACRVLKSNGIAIIETPYDNPIRIFRRNWETAKFLFKTPIRIAFEKLGFRKKTQHPKSFFYEYHFTKRELKSFIERAGFKIIGLFPKDDLSPKRHIGLWLDFHQFRNKNGKKFDLNVKGKFVKNILNIISPWLAASCVVCVAKK